MKRRPMTNFRFTSAQCIRHRFEQEFWAQRDNQQTSSYPSRSPRYNPQITGSCKGQPFYCNWINDNISNDISFIWLLNINIQIMSQKKDLSKRIRYCVLICESLYNDFENTSVCLVVSSRSSNWGITRPLTIRSIGSLKMISKKSFCFIPTTSSK